MDAKSTLIFLPVRSLDDVPNFKSDEEARAFWRTHFLDTPSIDSASDNLPDTFELEDFELEPE
ncbi:hypothetical protein [Deinococcus yavapaiensis]|uniref:hypothetical protein n=1 Tax=Deinococcus yavapaiensis TaxID=309889 RepID=UPI000DA115BD|nr:hypothetical protein [Deinococcus yavapaiensis]